MTRVLLIAALLLAASCERLAQPVLEAPPVLEFPQGQPVVPSPAALLRCADPDRWDWKWCANRRPEH